MTLVTVIYVLANVAYFAVIPPQQLITSPAVAVTFGNLTFGAARWAVPVFVALSTFGGVNGILFTSARLFMIGSQQGHLPVSFRFIHVNKRTPTPPLIFTCLMSLAMLIVSDVFVLINYFSQILWLSIAACVLALLYLRYSQPDMPRPIKVHLSLPVIFLICCLFLVALSIYKEPMNTVIGGLITVSGIPFYYACVKQNYAPAFLTKLHELLTIQFQKLFNVVMPDKEVEDKEEQL